MHFLTSTYDDYSNVYPSEPYTNGHESLPPEFFLFLFLFSVAMYALSSWLMAKIFEKTGVAGWKAWVPFYNSAVLLKIGDQSPWWILASFVPVVSIVASVFMIMAVNNINNGFGRGAGSTVLYVFLPIVWLFMLALGSDRWQRRPVHA